MNNGRWLLIAALALAGVYEFGAPLWHHWPTISALVWGLEKHSPTWAIVLVIGFVGLFWHFFIRDWMR